MKGWQLIYFVEPASTQPFLPLTPPLTRLPSCSSWGDRDLLILAYHYSTQLHKLLLNTSPPAWIVQVAHLRWVHVQYVTRQLSWPKSTLTSTPNARRTSGLKVPRRRTALPPPNRHRSKAVFRATFRHLSQKRTLWWSLLQAVYFKNPQFRRRLFKPKRPRLRKNDLTTLSMATTAKQEHRA